VKAGQEFCFIAKGHLVVMRVDERNGQHGRFAAVTISIRHVGEEIQGIDMVVTKEILVELGGPPAPEKPGESKPPPTKIPGPGDHG
jgi:hypothetical protein